MNRSVASPKMRDYARLLIRCEAGAPRSRESSDSTVLRVFVALRQSLSTLVGVQGFTTLLSRALTLAKSEVPSLAPLQIELGGPLGALDECFNNGDTEAGVALMAHLLGLLAVFIGESLMVEILLNVWPNSAFGDTLPGENEHDATRQSQNK